jgi:hypothetical protein
MNLLILESNYLWLQAGDLYTTIITLLALRWGGVEKDTRLVVIKTDTGYVAVSMDERVWSWERRGLNPQGREK